jgi:uncharacterized protein (TIGR03067 family)
MIVMFLFNLALALGSDDVNRVETLDQNESLRGTWRLVASTIGGNKLLRPLIEDHKLLIADNRATFRFTQKGTHTRVFDSVQVITIVPAMKPRAIDFAGKGREGQTEVRLGIYEIDGDLLRLCLAQLGQPRPTGFESNATNEWIVEEYVRVKRLTPDDPHAVGPLATEGIVERRNGPPRCVVVPRNLPLVDQCGRGRRRLLGTMCNERLLVRCRQRR